MRTARGDFCQPWCGQAAARLNRRAARPNAIRVSVINDRVDPVSGTPRASCHRPGLLWLAPNESSAKIAASSLVTFVFTVVMSAMPMINASAYHLVIAPVGPVAKKKREKVRVGVRLVSV